MKIRTAQITFNDLNLPSRLAPKLRGYISNKYPQFIETHNHIGNKFIYNYPVIQYKIINNNPIIIGLDNGVDVLKMIFDDLDSLNIEGINNEGFDNNISFEDSEWGEASDMLSYHFISPWMALNENNFKKYIECSEKQKQDLLSGILIGNILSASKTLKYNVITKLETELSLSLVHVNFKNKKMLSFKGWFSINFSIPDYWGLGKSVSRGFGTVKRI